MNDSKDIVKLINDLFYDSKVFLNESKKQSSINDFTLRCNRAAVLFAWAGFEGWINKTCSDLAHSLNTLSIHEKGFLLEKKVDIKKGRFFSSNAEKYESTENKMEFLLVTIAKNKLDKSTSHWQDFIEIKKYRDALIHPKIGRESEIDIKTVEKTLNVLVYFLNLLSQKLYKKKFKI